MFWLTFGLWLRLEQHPPDNALLAPRLDLAILRPRLPFSYLNNASRSHLNCGEIHGTVKKATHHSWQYRKTHHARVSRTQYKHEVVPQCPVSCVKAMVDDLASQRQRLADDIIKQDKEQRPVTKLNDAGRAVFEKAGYGDRIDKSSDLEVTTSWLPPVVQEHVRRVEHTEYRTELTRDIHRHHIYPKIQPISDPDPIILPTRHRFFSPRDGHWHEVVGDDAAIEILGEEVFLNGPKITRTERRPLDSTPSGPSRVIERERHGDEETDWTVTRGEGTDDEAVIRDGKLRDGRDSLDEVTEAVRTLQMTL